MKTFPKLLAVHLKRFDFNSHTRRSKKLNMHVSCPDVLDATSLAKHTASMCVSDNECAAEL